MTGGSLEVRPKKSRKRYSASEKLRIVKAADAAVASGKRGAVEALLRTEGIYSSHLSAWRQQLAARGTLDVSRAGLYRSRKPPAPAQTQRARPPSPRRLDDLERQRILDTLHQPEFADQPPTEVYATLLGLGIYLGSIRTMYRVLAAAGETKERRSQRAPHVHQKPTLTATAPNQVWTWDITKLATKERGVFLMAT